jgi:hypothetical protein
MDGWMADYLVVWKEGKMVEKTVYYLVEYLVDS